MAEKITRKLVNELGVLSRSDSGWSKELNLVSWNGRVPKLDLREWSGGKEKIGKGLTLKKSEAMRLRDILVALDFSTIPNSDGTTEPETIDNSVSNNNGGLVHNNESTNQSATGHDTALVQSNVPMHEVVPLQDIVPSAEEVVAV